MGKLNRIVPAVVAVLVVGRTATPPPTEPVMPSSTVVRPAAESLT